MRVKTDENLHEEIAATLRSKGIDALSVHDQGLQGQADTRISEVCRIEARTLLTLDLDFANIKQYPPKDFPGLVVLRLKNQSRGHVLKIVLSLLDYWEKEQVEGSLWIVEEHQIRIRREESHD